MFNKKRIVAVVCFLLLSFFMMTFAGRTENRAVATRDVTFVDSIVDEVIETQKVKLGAKITEPEAPYHQGYVFVGWVDQDTKENFDSSDIIEEDTKLETKYEEDRNNNRIPDSEDTYYLVSFIDTMGRITLKAERVLIGLSATAPSTYSYENYVFSGWDKSYTNVTSDLNVNTVYTYVEPVVSITYNVSYHMNGGLPQIEDLNSYKNDEVVVVNTEKVEKKDNTLLGYSLTNYGQITTTDAEKAVEIVKTFEIQNDTSLYAVWAIDKNGNDIPDYKEYLHLSYDENGGTPDIEDNTNYLAGDKAIISDTVLIKDKTKFLGWSLTDYNTITEQEDEDKVVFVNNLFEINENTILYAVYAQDENGNNTPDYKEFFSVTFIADGKEVRKDSIQYGKDVKSLPEIPNKIGHDEAVWDTLLSNLTYITGDKTVTAEYTINVYLVKYNDLLNNSVLSVKINHGEKLSSKTTSSVGYTFTGWYSDKDELTESNKWNFDTNIVESNLDLYAGYDLNSYTISYELNGGINNKLNPSSYNIESNTITFAEPTRAGYVFAGWYSEKALTNIKTDIIAGSTGNVTVYAKWQIINYTINYELNGGVNNSLNPSSYNIESNTITFAEPTRVGYTFKGWYSDEEFVTIIPNVAKNSTGNVTIYAKWELNNYKISYELNGGVNNRLNPGSYSYESDTITFAEPTRVGYAFKGWYNDAEFVTSKPNITKNSTGNVTIYAKWEITNYTISYGLNGGVNNSINPSSYNIESDTITFAEPIRTGHTFKGWYSDEALTDAKTGIVAGSTGNVNVYAKFVINTYSVVLDSPNGNVTGSTTKTTDHGGSVEFIVDAKEGFEFDNVVCTNGQTGSYDDKTNRLSVTNITSETTCTLSFSSVPKLSVNFDRNGSEGENLSLGCYCYNDAEFCPITTPTIVREGFTTVGWSKENDSKTAEYNENTEISVDDDLNGKKLYAITYKTFTINYLCSASGCTSSVTNPKSDATIWNNNTSVTAVLIVNPFSKSGYTFSNWNTIASGTGTSYTDYMELAYNANPLINLYAQWSINSYDINYILDGGSNSGSNPNKYTVESDTIVFSNPTKNGYTFNGWFTESAYINSKPSILSGSTGNVDVYAKWELNNYAISYELNGGVNNSLNPSSYNVESNTITFAEPTRLGYTFRGWYSDEALTVVKNNISSHSTGNVTVYAKWELNNYTISYELNGGVNNSLNPSSYNVESNTITFAEPTRLGYTFKGWYSDAEFVTVKPSIAKNSTGNVTVYAKWEIQTRTISFIVDGQEYTKKVVNYNTSLTDIPSIPAKTGYTDVAPVWQLNENNFDFSTAITENIILVAKYTINTYNVYFKADGNTVATIPVNHGNSITAASTSVIPAKTGYTDVAPYWNVSDLELLNNITEDKVVNAVYTANTYSITINVTGSGNVVAGGSTITVSGSKDVTYNSNLLLKFNPSDKYYLKGISINNVALSNVKLLTEYTLSNISSDIVVDVEYASLTDNVLFDESPFHAVYIESRWVDIRFKRKYLCSDPTNSATCDFSASPIDVQVYHNNSDGTIPADNYSSSKNTLAFPNWDRDNQYKNIDNGWHLHVTDSYNGQGNIKNAKVIFITYVLQDEDNNDWRFVLKYLKGSNNNFYISEFIKFKVS